MSTVGIRYMIDDVPAAIRFYTTQLGFSLDLDASPAFASVGRDGVRLLLSGKTSDRSPATQAQRRGRGFHFGCLNRSNSSRRGRQ